MTPPETAPLASSQAPVVDNPVGTLRTIFGTVRPAAGPRLHRAAGDDALANPRIAIIDDQSVNVKVVQKYLSLAGYKQFITTTDATQALDLVHTERPDVVLLDVMMPEISGLEILENLRKNEEHRDLPVIILTAANDQATKITALSLGATEFLGKPVDSVELQVRLRNVLSAKAHHDRIKNYAWEMELEVAVRSAELAHAYREVVGCLARVGEYRDNEAGKHVLRVGRYAELIARRLGLDDEMVERIAEAAPLHDIGKVGIPDSVLLKPGRLDAEEMERVRRHCDYGSAICAPGWSRNPDGASPVPATGTSVLAMAATIALTHHEHWDGGGYPRGLAGEQIPLEGRITAVADVFDALTSRRPYKPAYSVERSLAILRTQRGKQFDPLVLDAFFDALDDVLAVHRELHELQDGDPTTGAVDR